MEEGIIYQSGVTRARNKEEHKLPNPKAKRRQPFFRLTGRDRRLIEAIYRYRALSTPQVERLLFVPPGGWDRQTKNTRCHERLMLLFRAGYIVRYEQPQRLSEGRKPYVYFLDRKGVKLLAEWHNVEEASLKWDRKRSSIRLLFLDHLLTINGVRIAIELGAQMLGIDIELWLDELALKRAQKESAEAERQAAVQSDGYFVLRYQGRRAHFFLEVDRATEDNRRFAAKVRAYVDYVESGEYEKQFGTRSLRVLVVTTSGERLTNLRKATEMAGGGPMFWFTTLALVRPSDVLDVRIWQKAREPGSYSVTYGLPKG